MFNVADRIGSAGVLRHALIVEIYLAFCVHGNVFQQRVAAQRVIDIRFGLFVQVNNLGIAAAFQVEDSVVVPAVLVITDKVAVGVRGQGGLAGA